MKNFLIVLCVMLATSVANVNGEEKCIADAISIPLHVEYVNPYSHGTMHRAPRLHLLVYYDGHILFFRNLTSNYVLSIIDDKGNQVHAAFIPFGTQIYELPLLKEGQYTMKLSTETCLYVGEIEICKE